jgi:hypothetical protein
MEEQSSMFFFLFGRAWDCYAGARSALCMEVYPAGWFVARRAVCIYRKLKYCKVRTGLVT